MCIIIIYAYLLAVNMCNSYLEKYFKVYTNIFYMIKFEVTDYKAKFNKKNVIFVTIIYYYYFTFIVMSILSKVYEKIKTDCSQLLP